MATIAQIVPTPVRRFAWPVEFLRDELAPYPGRAALVARMVIASTLVMILTMTFRIPYGAYGAVFAITLPRESLDKTAAEVRALALGVAVGAAYAAIGATLFLGDPLLRFVWVVGSLFLIFYALSATNNYTGAARFGYLVVLTIPLWDQNISAAQKIENTLWIAGVITMASVIGLLLELAFAGLRRANELIEAIAQRLTCVEAVLANYADGRPLDTAHQSAIAHLAIVGTSRLRRILQRSNYELHYRQQMGAVVALTGRLVDLTANLAQFGHGIPDADRERIRKVTRALAEIHAGLVKGTVPRTARLPDKVQVPSSLPLLNELEKTVSLIPEAFEGSQSLVMFAPPAAGTTTPRATPFLADALSNPEHVKFGLRGCLAASLCYLAYTALFWPEISTAVTTCLLTALTTVGASRQKQVLRFAGALIGGVGIGIGAEIFILPNIDSISAFTVLFLAVAAAAAWIATSGPRLSYFGVQVAVAFCLINLQEFKEQTSLAVARDRVVGILLGLSMMWLVFDHLWSAPAGVELRKSFVSTLRSLAQLAKEPLSKDPVAAAERSYALREAINVQFDKVRSFVDAVLFEFGPTRQQDLALRDHIRRWQPQLRTLFVMRIASLKYRLQLPGFELPEAVLLAQQQYDGASARVLEEMADRIEGKGPPVRPASAGSGEFDELLRREGTTEDPHLRSLLTLIRGIDGLTTSLADEIAIAMESNRPNSLNEAN